MRMIDMTGRRFGRLEVIRREGSNKKGEAVWLCRCDCGGEKIVRGTKLRRGETKSCGCFEQETRVRNGHKRMQPTHNMSQSRLYEVWHGMKARCYRKTHPHYKDYGGRGIIVCNEWKDDFQAFADWALSHGYDEDAPKGACTLDRINPNGDYEPSNCRFADMAVQQNNRRDRMGKRAVKGADGIYHVTPQLRKEGCR